MEIEPKPEDIALFTIIDTQISVIENSLKLATEARESLISMVENKYEAKLDRNTGKLIKTEKTDDSTQS